MSKLPRTLFILTISILPLTTTAQEWVVRYNGPGNSEDRAFALEIDNTGNIYVTGASANSATDVDYATVKYDPTGIQQWVARYGGSGIDIARDITVDNDGNVYVTGSRSGGGLTNDDYATVKYDSYGVEQWAVRYTSPFDYPDRARALVVDDAGNVYVTGSSGHFSYYNYATIKYDSSGVEQWVVTYGSIISQDEACAIVLDNEANVIVTGASSDQISSFDYATVKYDSTGVEQWVIRYDGPLSSGDFANAMAIDEAGNVYVTGQSAGQGSGCDYATIKYDASGVEQWVARYNGPDNGDDRAYAIVVDLVGNVYVTGKSNGSGTGPDYVTVKYDSSGTEQWVERYNGPANGEDYAYAIAVSSTGHICVTGYSNGIGTYEDYTTIMYDSSGMLQCIERYNGPGNSCDEARAIVVQSGDYVYVTGSSMGDGTHMDFATIKYTCTGTNEYKPISITNDRVISTVISSFLQLPEGRKCKVFDITGRVVMPETMKPGVYFVEVEGEITGKVVKVR